MGLIVSIYRDTYRSRSQIFRGIDRLTIVNVDGPFDPTPDAPAARLSTNGLGNLIVVPDQVDPGVVLAMGGSYAATSDSRWSDAVRFYGAVPIHDYDLTA